MDKAKRKDNYKATVSGLYDKSFRGCLEAKIHLAKAIYFGHFGLEVDEYVAAYKFIGIYDIDEDAQDAVVAAFQAKRERHFTGVSKMKCLTTSLKKTKNFRKGHLCKKPRHLLQF